MRVSKKYSSKWLRADGLQGRSVRVEIDRVEENVTMGMPKEQKDVVYFVGLDKGLVLNKARAESLAQILCDDSDGWPGGIVDLYTVETEMGDGIRIRRAESKPTEQGNNLYDEANPPPAEDLDDQIPF
jgi:hypothetical protein